MGSERKLSLHLVLECEKLISRIEDCYDGEGEQDDAQLKQAPLEALAGCWKDKVLTSEQGKHSLVYADVQMDRE